MERLAEAVDQRVEMGVAPLDEDLLGPLDVRGLDRDAPVGRQDLHLARRPAGHTTCCAS